MRVRDNGAPTPRSNTTLLTVTILRNLANPVFNPTIYNVAILDTTLLGIIITRVNATDSDTRVCTERERERKGRRWGRGVRIGVGGGVGV